MDKGYLFHTPWGFGGVEYVRIWAEKLVFQAAVFPDFAACDWRRFIPSLCANAQ
jgi:hypothetical protein